MNRALAEWNRAVAEDALDCNDCMLRGAAMGVGNG
jgi:hypothetical protein